MSLIHHADQVTAEMVALVCHACKTSFELDYLADLGDPLRCTACGSGGFIPRSRSRMDQRFPPPLSSAFTPVPDALMEWAGDLGLGPHELLLVIALERYRRLMGDEVFPGRATLARLTRLSEHQIKRASSKLVDKGLMVRRQPGNAEQKRQGRARNRYCLDRLWLQLATEAGHLTRTDAPQTDSHADFDEHQRPQTDPGEGLRAEHDAFAGADDDVCSAPAHPEVDVVEADVVEGEPVGTDAASPQPAADYDDQWLTIKRSLGKPPPLRSERRVIADLTDDEIVQAFPGSSIEATA